MPNEPAPPALLETTLESLTPDMFNANRGTQRGQALLEASLRTRGAARSIVLDKHGNIIAGNKTAEAAASVGLENLLVVQTTGEQLVAVQRMDLDLTEEGGAARILATEDNRIAEVSLDWDLEILSAQIEEGVKQIHLFNDLELQEMYAQLQNDTSFLDPFIAGATSAPSPTAALEERAAERGLSAPSGDTVPDEVGETVTLATDPASLPASAPTVEVVKLNFALPEALRNRVTERLNAIKNENNYPTLAHALCHLLDIPYDIS